MKRAEFIKTFVALIDRGRCVNFPGIRLSERMAAQVDDESKAAKLWRKHRAHYSALPVEEFKRQAAARVVALRFGAGYVSSWTRTQEAQEASR